MSDATQTAQPEQQQKMPLLKSKKELVALVAAALVFGVVIYKTYFGKGEELPEPAELAGPATAVTAPAAGTEAAQEPEVIPLQAILASLNSESDAAAERSKAPAKLTRSPFEMSPSLRKAVYNIKGAAPPKALSSEPVILTAQNAHSVLAKIPGAERAAAAGLTLDAVMITSTWRGASINGEIIPLGDAVLGFTLAAVLGDRVTLQRGKHRIGLLVRPPAASGGAGGKNHTRTWRLPK